MAWLETVVCSSHKKVDARFLRVLKVPGAQKKTRWLLTVMGGEICRWPTAVSCTNIIQNEKTYAINIENSYG